MFILRKKLYYTSTEEKKKIKASHFLCLSKLINEEAQTNIQARKARKPISKFEVSHRGKHAAFIFVQKEAKSYASETDIYMLVQLDRDLSSTMKSESKDYIFSYKMSKFAWVGRIQREL